MEARKGLGSGEQPHRMSFPVGNHPLPAPCPPSLQCGALRELKAQAGTCQSQPTPPPRPPSPGGQIILSLSQPDKITNANSIKSPLKVFNYQTVPKTKDSGSGREAGGRRLMEVGGAEAGSNSPSSSGKRAGPGPLLSRVLGRAVTRNFRSHIRNSGH